MAIKKLAIRNARTPSEKVTIDTGPGITKQNHKAECDVNLILSRYQKTGVITHRQEYEPQYDDATGIDYQDALNLVISANQMFQDLPSSVRKRFEHDPSNFMAFVNDPANMPEMIEMGLAVDTTPVEPAPQKVEIVNPTQTPKDGA